MKALKIAIAALLLATLSLGISIGHALAIDTDDCIAEPASIYAPQGFICPPMYGEGIASTWQGPGVASNSCVWPWLDCTPIRITVLETGAWIEVRPTQWCMCWVGVTGPLGETARIVDLGPDEVRALGLPGPGLWPVRVEPAGGVEYHQEQPAGAGPARDTPPSEDPPASTDGESGSGQTPQAIPDTAMARP